MAFIRAYGAQGDPRTFRSTLRSGQLLRGERLQRMKILSARRGRRGTAARRRLTLAAGDPFRLRMPKFIRKLSLQSVIKGVSKLGKIASVLPGVGAVAGAISNVADELTTQPVATGTVGQVAMRGYTVPGIEVTPENQGQVYNVFDRRRRVAEEEADDTDDTDDTDDSDVSDVGDEDAADDEGSE